MNASRSSTICDIAKALGISAITGSRALNSHSRVDDETQRKVTQKAAELNYRPNRWARTLVTNRSFLGGLVVPDIFHSFFGEVTRGIKKIIEEQEYDRLLGHTDREPKIEKREIDALLASRIDRLIMASDQPEELRAYFSRLEKQGENPAWFVPGNFHLRDSMEAARFLMSLANRPTAIFAGNDNSAFGVMRGCREAGFQVPQQVSVIGAGNVEGDQHPSPFLSTAHWGRLEMGREAVRILLNQISGSRSARVTKKVFPPTCWFGSPLGPYRMQ